MIVDTLDNLNYYYGLCKGLDGALSALKHFLLSYIPPGEYPNYPFEDCDTVLKILEPRLITEDEGIPWEYHANHIDVHCVLKGGSELIGYVPRSRLSGWKYDPADDVAYTKADSEYMPVWLGENDFAVFFPQDAHRKVRSSGTDGYHKVVFKVPVDGFKLPV